MRLAALLVLVGCSARLGGAGGGVADENDDLRPDAALITSADAAPDSPMPIAAVDNACGVASNHGDLGSLTARAGSVLQDGSTTNRISYVSAPTPLTATQAAPDVVVVELWDNFGVFAGGAARSGTFQIAGTETDYDTCGVCVLMLANYANDTPAKLLLATSGTVTVTSVGTGAGQTTQLSVANASFVEIAANAETGYQTVAGSNCPGPITKAALSGTL